MGPVLRVSHSHTSNEQTKRTLRVFLSNLAADQYVEVSDLAAAEDAFDLENARVPSWTLRIEGRLLDVSADITLISSRVHAFDDDCPQQPGSRRPQPNPPKFSSFLKSVIVDIQRDPNLYPEPNLVEVYATLVSHALVCSQTYS